ncbi:hypothetical protein [Achromobacter pulmonis]|nr:hypothetical protein [Achromobacter pulmonis]
MPYLDVWGFCTLRRQEKTYKPRNSTVCMDFDGKIRLVCREYSVHSARPTCARFEEMMNFWIPVVFGTFKLLVLGTGMYLAIKSHYDGEKEEKKKKQEMKAP